LSCMNAVKYQAGDTIAAIATPPGTGAIGMVRLSGPDAIRLAGSVFRGAGLEKAPGYSAHFGQIVDGERLLDEAVAILYRAPRSYTGEDMVEFSCHGSPYILQSVLQLLLSKGARLAGPGEFTMRAFLNGKLDLSQAEAVADLIEARTEASHRAAISQMRGGYASELRSLREKLVHFASLVELELDFSEEDVEFAQRDQLLDTVRQLKQVTSRLIKSFALGNAIREGVPTVIAGRPNAGKSTLLNALLREERAIVSEIPGTTRDTIEEVLNLQGILFRLIDTAGLRDAADALEAMGVQRTLEKIHQSALVIYVFDPIGSTHQDVEEGLRQIPEGVPVLLAASKCDLTEAAEVVADFKGLPNLFVLSGKTGEGLQALEEAMVQSIMSEEISPESPIVTSLRHAEALQRALAALHDVEAGLQEKRSGELLALDIRVALDALGTITGEVTTDDLLENIFSRFCIGK